MDSPAALETNNVTSRSYLPANVTNIVMRIRQEEGSQPDMEGSCGMPIRGGLARAKPASDRHFPLVGAEDGAHHVGDLAVRAYATLGEISDVMRSVFGAYQGKVTV